jgi:predicted nucleic acid binding AN1-type Zn finger protein
MIAKKVQKWVMKNLIYKVKLNIRWVEYKKYSRDSKGSLTEVKEIMMMVVWLKKLLIQCTKSDYLIWIFVQSIKFLI